MPTYDAVARFLAEYARLSPSQQRAFRAAQQLFVDGLRDGGRMHPRLRVKALIPLRPAIILLAPR